MQRFNLVCDNEFQKTTSETLFFVGNLVGTLIIGTIADWYGRKISYVLFLILWTFFGVGGYFANSAYLWMTMRFFVGICTMCYHTVAAIYGVEITSGITNIKHNF